MNFVRTPEAGSVVRLYDLNPGAFEGVERFSLEYGSWVMTTNIPPKCLTVCATDKHSAEDTTNVKVIPSLGIFDLPDEHPYFLSYNPPSGYTPNRDVFVYRT